VCSDVTAWEQQSGNRVYERRSRSGEIFSNAVERFVGDLLRVKADKNASGRVYRSIGKTSFGDDPVNFDVFKGVLDGLKALGLVGHRKGQTRYYETGFDPGHKVTISGRAARFWATPKLVKLAAGHGVHSGNVGNHFAPEPPTNPLVLKDYATGRGRMLILMRTHRVPSFSTHDGLIVPKSKADLAKTILAKEYRRVVGVEPMLTVEPENLYGGALDL
jgi:hypothetical protein